jgi:5-methylcytosine-specific restriction protein A
MLPHLIRHQTNGDEPDGITTEDLTRFRLHKRLERDSRLIVEVKKRLGFVRQVCDLNLEKKYGSIGVGYIEAHHLTPVALLKGSKVSRDRRKISPFCVQLSSNDSQVRMCE